jgi:hypothetical protein
MLMKSVAIIEQTSWSGKANLPDIFLEGKINVVGFLDVTMKN